MVLSSHLIWYRPCFESILLPRYFACTTFLKSCFLTFFFLLTSYQEENVKRPGWGSRLYCCLARAPHSCLVQSTVWCINVAQRVRVLPKWKQTIQLTSLICPISSSSDFHRRIVVPPFLQSLLLSSLPLYCVCQLISPNPLILIVWCDDDDMWRL